MKHLILTLISALVLACGSSKLRVATYNIAWEEWDTRKELILQTIRDIDPDVIGIQEALPDSFQYLCVQLRPTHLAVVVANPNGSMNPIFYRKELGLADYGWFWHSSTPTIDGSDDWPRDPSLEHDGPRNTTWVQLKTELGDVQVFNTHVGGDQIEPSFRLIHDEVLSSYGTKILLGDFNDLPTPDNPWHLPSHEKMLTSDGELTEGFHEVLPNSKETGGCNLYGPCPQWGFDARVDWVFATKEIAPIWAEMPNPTKGEMNASDHRPIVVDYDKR